MKVTPSTSCEFKTWAWSTKLYQSYKILTSKKIGLDDAEILSTEALGKLGYSAQDASTIAHHLSDSELRGYGVAALALILSIADRLAGRLAQTETQAT
jgi:LDH2 family malate/lactate/ureidoglycolate dehydrogenase